jgi:hypothetical protein
MSLINDALKRASQQPPPPPAGPALRPAQPETAGRRGVGLLIPAALVLVALLGLFLAWQLREKASVPATVAARVSAQPEAAAQPPATQPGAPAPVVATTVSAPTPSASTVPGLAAAKSTIAQAAALAAAPAAANAVMDSDAAASVVAEPVEPPAPPKPAPWKLQAIIFNPARPSATISGKTVFIGDRVGDLRVIKITQDSVMLAGGGQTRTLTLP